MVERRDYRDGILLEYRANPKTGARRGPYRYFEWRENGRQRTLYLGSTDDPEAKLAETIGGQRVGSGEVHHVHHRTGNLHHKRARHGGENPTQECGRSLGRGSLSPSSSGNGFGCNALRGVAALPAGSVLRRIGWVTPPARSWLCGHIASYALGLLARRSEDKLTRRLYPEDLFRASLPRPTAPIATVPSRSPIFTDLFTNVYRHLHHYWADPG